VIGYYVHHQGSGHLHRMLAVVERLDVPVTVLSSLPRPEGCKLRWIRLAADDVGRPPVERDARGTFHWVPRYDDGLRQRMAQVTSWVADVRPSLVVVDVSVEVAVQVRITGTPVVVVALPGDRLDRPHRLAYDLAEALLAAWPVAICAPDWPTSWLEKTWFVGAISRFDARKAPTAANPGGASRRALLLWGTGGGSPTQSDIKELRAATPTWDWEIAVPATGTVRSADELWAALCRADVVVSHAGQNAVAEIAAARVPAVLVAQDRPFDEQGYTVRALSKAGIAIGLFAWPHPPRWNSLLDQAVHLGGHGWSSWGDGYGATRAAERIRALEVSLA
jgi:hypothetical protein